MNEFDFIREIKKKFPNSWEKSIGNDSAVFQLSSKTGLATKDLLVEGVHFYPEIPLQALAYKALAVNISDIVSDGGKPLFFLIGVGCPKEKTSRLEKLYHFFYQYCSQWNIPIIGGDTVNSPHFFISVTCIGKSLSRQPWLRKNAQTGDLIYVTGNLGSSSFGFSKIKEKGHDLSDKDIKNHLFPPVRLEVSEVLKNKVNAAADISDGLFKDLSRILEESGKGAVIDDEAVPYASSIPEKDFAYYGGEDYEILFTSSKKIDTKLIENKYQLKINCIGKITEEKNKIILKKKEKSVLLNMQEINEKGFSHWL